jgi:hypothetical protein
MRVVLVVVAQVAQPSAGVAGPRAVVLDVVHDYRDFSDGETRTGTGDTTISVVCLLRTAVHGGHARRTTHLQTEGSRVARGLAMFRP